MQKNENQKLIRKMANHEKRKIILQNLKLKIKNFIKI